MMAMLKSQLEQMQKSGGGQLPYAYAFGKPLTEEEFKAKRAAEGATVIKTSDLARQKLRQKLATHRLSRAPKHAIQHQRPATDVSNGGDGAPSQTLIAGERNANAEATHP
jgi:hypothetical protein